jgi:hypothetical protein
MAIMCEECKCDIEKNEAGEYGGCESGCLCCNENIEELAQERATQILALTDDKRAELEEEEDMGDSNPIIHAEQGPNRFSLMSLFFTDSDGVQIQEDTDTGEITIKYFTDSNEIELDTGALYEWALDYYKTN